MKNYNVTFTLKDADGAFESKTQRMQAPDIPGLFILLATLPKMNDSRCPCTGIKVKEIEV